MLERRRYKRFNVEGSVTLRLKDGTDRTVKADLVSISFAGITTVYLQEKIEPGTYVKLELISKLWDGPIICEGKIIHTEEIEMHGSNVFRTGIELTKADATAIQNILNLIQRNIIAEIKEKRSKKTQPRTKKTWL